MAELVCMRVDARVAALLFIRTKMSLIGSAMRKRKQETHAIKRTTHNRAQMIKG